MEKKVEELKEKAEKSAMQMIPTVPFGTTSFAELEQHEQGMQFVKGISDTFITYADIASAILFDNVVESGDMVKAIANLTNEFLSRIRELDINSNEFKSKDNTVYKSSSVTLYKDGDELRWMGIPTNKFMDRDIPPDILSEKAHKEFVEKLDKGLAPMPVLFVWHINNPVGKSTWVDYDEKGFLVAGGIVYKEYQDFVINLLNNAKEPVGMSHGMEKAKIARHKELNHVIDSYESFEFTFLPESEAANLLTAFGLDT